MQPTWQTPLPIYRRSPRCSKTYFGPMIMAFARLEDEGGPALERDLLDPMHGANRGGDAALVAPAEYVEVVAVRA